MFLSRLGISQRADMKPSDRSLNNLGYHAHVRRRFYAQLCKGFEVLPHAKQEFDILTLLIDIQWLLPYCNSVNKSGK